MSHITDLNNSKTAVVQREELRGSFLKDHAEKIDNSIRELGADQYDLWLPETHSLPFVVRPDEQVMGIVYGRYKQIAEPRVGRGAFVATDKRLLLVDKKPLFIRCDEIAYRAISGVSYNRVGPVGTVTLHTKLGDISVRTFNQDCAYHFVGAIEANIFRRDGRYGVYDD